MTRAVIYRHDERSNSSNHKLFPRASTNHSSTSGPRKTDRKRLCVAYSYEMVEPRGKGCVRKGRSTSDPVPARSPPPSNRTTMLIRCSKEEAQRIRAGAKRRSTTISHFVLHALAVSWSAGDSILMDMLPMIKRRLVGPPT